MINLIFDIFLWSSLGASILLVLASELRYRNWKEERIARLQAIGVDTTMPLGRIANHTPTSGSRIHRVTDLSTGLSINAQSFAFIDVLDTMASHRQWMTEDITDDIAQVRHEARVARRYGTFPDGWDRVL